ncbi:T9SS type A sorting domain-containing protein [Pontibacter vulgaris]|uniref:T9SS type A sorting domain-containing protein n=1 Tax=Pontibacter vulgaris TaxID=2905679 RepID=UPI001FA78FD8|nr:T9SS type A sorting domain-containing protein [Pontibacter vulgaris]
MKLKLALTFLLSCYGMVAMAQAVLSPLQQEPRQVKSYTSKPLRVAALSLPFFDDFATTTISPDPARWVNGGVYVNSRFAIEPITKNVASFDGLNAAGKPYQPGSVGTGTSDTLTSQPIVLSTLIPSDSVYLSFYWQAGGLGDVPDKSGTNPVYFQLEFKDASGNWQQVWQQPGLGETTQFTQVFIAIKDARFLHDSFQFRFRSFGQRGGLGDNWNLDYVELDRNRRKGQNTSRDIAISQTVTPLLKNYTAMPLRQFLENPAASLREEVTATINNLGDLPGAINWRGFIRRADETVADTFLRSQGLIPAVARQFEIKGTPSLAALALPEENFALLHGMVLDTKEQNPLQRANDSTFRKTEFADYYAYDDGTAEAGFSYIASGNSQVAQRFDLNRPDQVRGFQVYFPRVRNMIEGSSITFRVWKDDNGKPGETLGEQSFHVKYSDNLNQFYTIELAKPVGVDGSFYIGWSQPGSLFLNIGFDRNERATGRRFLWSTQNGWAEDKTIEGAIMMRPLMAGMALGIEDEELANKLKVYPNPSAGTIAINEAFKTLDVIDIAGRKVYGQDFSGIINSPISLKQLAPGLYTLRIQTQNTIITRKLILTTP